MSDAQEEWRPVVGYEGVYEVSSLGRVRSLPRVHYRKSDGAGCRYKGGLRKLGHEFGHPCVSLSAAGRRSLRKRIYVLVAEAFTDWKLEGGTIDFIDGNYGSPRLDNLRFIPNSVEGEIWKACPGFEQDYEVSSRGRVRAILGEVPVRRNGGLHRRIRRPRILKGALSGGYPAVNLCFGGGRTQTNHVHVLVCVAFHGPRPPQHEACHRDGDRLNARAENLYWGTQAQNRADAYVKGFAQLAGISIEDAWAIVRART